MHIGELSGFRGEGHSSRLYGSRLGKTAFEVPVQESTTTIAVTAIAEILIVASFLTDNRPPESARLLGNPGLFAHCAPPHRPAVNRFVSICLMHLKFPATIEGAATRRRGG